MRYLFIVIGYSNFLDTPTLCLMFCAASFKSATEENVPQNVVWLKGKIYAFKPGDIFCSFLTKSDSMKQFFVAPHAWEEKTL